MGLFGMSKKDEKEVTKTVNETVKEGKKVMKEVAKKGKAIGKEVLKKGQELSKVAKLQAEVVKCKA